MVISSTSPYQPVPGEHIDQSLVNRTNQSHHNQLQMDSCLAVGPTYVLASVHVRNDVTNRSWLQYSLDLRSNVLVISLFGGDSDIVRDAFERTKRTVFKHRSFRVSRFGSYGINKLKIVVYLDNETLDLGVDESYSLYVAKQDGLSIIGEAAIEVHLCDSSLKRLAAGRTVEKVGVPTSVPVRMAHDLLLAGHRYLDVRYCNIWFDSTRQEGVSSLSCEVSERICSFDLIFRTLRNSVLDIFVGAVNVPYMLKVVDGKHVAVLGCKSGKRSLLAATDLFAALNLTAGEEVEIEYEVDGWFYAVAYVLSGMYGSVGQLGVGNAILIIVQITVFFGIIVMCLDELLQKGYGLGSGYLPVHCDQYLVPDLLQKRFGDNSFAGNAALCGSSSLPDCLLHYLQQHMLKLWFPQILVHCPRRPHWLSTKEKV
ncbi:hypothetical protein Sjap_003130 [Stephania japonica]|uniref:Uncharacterized protein n=1 Tax=Stephania japonica TaxID=461633 RepID=A0AAP0PUS4_9MAGN